MALFFSFLDMWFTAMLWAFATIVAAMVLIITLLAFDDATQVRGVKRRSSAAARLARLIGTLPRPWLW